MRLRTLVKGTRTALEYIVGADILAERKLAASLHREGRINEYTLHQVNTQVAWRCVFRYLPSIGIATTTYLFSDGHPGASTAAMYTAITSALDGMITFGRWHQRKTAEEAERRRRQTEEAFKSILDEVFKKLHEQTRQYSTAAPAKHTYVAPDRAYELIGVKRSAPRDEIKNEYRKIAKAYHPDKTKGDRRKENAFKDISMAYTQIEKQWRSEDGKLHA